MPQGTDSLLLQLFTIFVWAKVFGELFERMHLPAVLGEILAGVILGPYLTRFVLPGDTIYSIAKFTVRDSARERMESVTELSSAACCTQHCCRISVLVWRFANS